MDLMTSLNSPCPCNSGKLLRHCCLYSITPPRSDTTPKLPKTGFAHEGCYAAKLNDCSTKISREHYTSKILLEIIQDGSTLNVSGFPWQDEGSIKSVPPQALTAKVLCERHNSALSPLDVMAAEFFSTLDQLNKEASGDTSEKLDWPVLFNGHDIEAWMLKVMFGSVVSGNSRASGNKKIEARPHIEGLKVLFEQWIQTPPRGLYVAGRVGAVFENSRKSGYTTMTRKGIPLAGIFFFPTLTLVLHLADVKPTDSFYRPCSITYTDGNTEKALFFGWEGNEGGQDIVMKFDPYQRVK